MTDLITLTSPWTLYELKYPPWLRIWFRYRRLKKALPSIHLVQREVLEMMETEEWDELKQLIT